MNTTDDIFTKEQRELDRMPERQTISPRRLTQKPVDFFLKAREILQKQDIQRKTKEMERMSTEHVFPIGYPKYETISLKPCSSEKEEEKESYYELRNKNI